LIFLFSCCGNKDLNQNTNTHPPISNSIFLASPIHENKNKEIIVNYPKLIKFKQKHSKPNIESPEEYNDDNYYKKPTKITSDLKNDTLFVFVNKFGNCTRKYYGEIEMSYDSLTLILKHKGTIQKHKDGTIDTIYYIQKGLCRFDFKYIISPIEKSPKHIIVIEKQPPY
jgi:hypothetical protein